MENPNQSVEIWDQCRKFFSVASDMELYSQGQFLLQHFDRDKVIEQIQKIIQKYEPEINMLGSFEIEAKVIKRKKYYVVYIKEGSEIVDILNVIEAHISLMNLENLRIYKEMRNSVNRRVNCEAANITRTVSAASKQCEDILYIQKHYGFNNLQDGLRQMAEVRLQHPDATLQELGGLLDPPVGKSGVNHRLRKLCELAEKIRS